MPDNQMRKLPDDGSCPCDLAEPYMRCCGRYHAGATVPSAVALMRSRYSAFVLHNADYLLHSWAPQNRPAQLEFDPAQRWLGLKIKATLAGVDNDLTGEVVFVARYKIRGKGFRLEETARFERLRGATNETALSSAQASSLGRWVYVDGAIRGTP